MKKLKDIFDGNYTDDQPPFYAKTSIGEISLTSTSAMLTKNVAFNKYHLKTIRAGKLYKPLSRIIDLTHE